jgi:hypothetical protein
MVMLNEALRGRHPPGIWGTSPAETTMRLGGLLLKRENLVFLLFVAALAFAVVFAVERAGGPAAGLDAYLPNVRVFLLALSGCLCAAIAWLLVRHRPDSPTKFLLEAPQSRALWHALAQGLPLILAVAFFMPSFSMIKAGLPLFNTYHWDAEFIALDRALHFGTDPWRLLQPVLGHPLVTAALAQLYHTWFLLIYAGTLFFALLVKDAALRCRYFLAYFLTWTIGGMAMAVGFASVGPCFLEPILGQAHFAEQMAYLEAANRQYPVATLEVQHALVEWFRSGDLTLGRGISAMPSMHVALAFLFFLAMRKVSRAAGWFFGAYCAAIMIASVHLGYHYAVDGYVSLALVAGVWWLAGKIAPRLISPEPQPIPTTEIPGVPARA